MKKLIFLSFIIFISFFTINSQTVTSLGITGTYYDIRADNNNNIHILWIDNGWAKYGQVVNRQVVNQVTIPVTDRNEVVTDKFRPRLSVKPDGSEVHFVWVTPDVQSRDLMHAWKDSGGTWRKEKIFTSSRYVEYPTYTIDSSGVQHAACIEWVSTNLLINIAYYRKPSGGSWTRMTDIAPRTAEHKWPNLFTDTNGNVHVTWDKNKDVIQYRSTSSGGDLSASSTTTLPILHTGNKQAEVFADASGNVHVAALSYNSPGSSGGVDYWVKPAGGSFSSPIQVTGGNFSLMYYFPHPAVIARSTDMVAVSWVEEPRSPATVRVSIYDGGWTVYTISTTANVKDDTRTTMAMDDSTAYMVWREADGSLWLATFDYSIFGVISPNGGEEWGWGETHEIRWDLESGTGDVDIHLYKNDVDLGPIASDVPDTGSYIWKINNLESGSEIVNGTDYKIEVKSINGSDSDISNSNFTIKTVLLVTSPVATDIWSTGNTYDITWKNPEGASSGIKINIYKDSIDVENFIEQLTGPNNGSLSWTIPDTYEEGNYILRVKTDDSVHIADSDMFSIIEGTPGDPTITVTSPTSADTWYKDSSYDITWTKSGTQSAIVNIKVYIGSIDPSNLVQQLSGPNSGTYNWTIPGTYTDGSYILRVETDDAQVSGDSGVFSIAVNAGAPSITVTSPTSSDTWDKGSTYNITWDRNGTLSANIKINVYRNSIDAPNFVGQLTGPNSGIYSWTIPGTYTAGNYILRIKTDDNLVTDDSDVFVIAENSTIPSITITSPTSSDTWDKGSTYNITWDRNGTLSANIKINVYKDSILAGNFVGQLTGPNSGTYSWTIPGTYTAGNYILRMKTDDNLVTDDSDVFVIAENSTTPSITITSPTSSDTWDKGSTYNITWDRNGTLSANIKINVYKDSILAGNFIEQLTGPNSGTYSWTIPGTYTAGNYILRMKTDDNLVTDDSDVFQISDGGTPPPASITVVSPSSCSSWPMDNTYTITWLKDGTQSVNIVVNIYKDSIDEANFIEQLTGPNSGSILWPIPNSYENGNYILRIKTDDDLVTGDSGLFAVNSTIMNAPSITVTSPTSCDTWSKLKTYKIAWSKAGTMSANVKINIFKDSIDSANFVQQLTGPNTGSMDWTIPGAYVNGNYIIRVKTDDSAVVGDSDLFAVTD